MKCKLDWILVWQGLEKKKRTNIYPLYQIVFKFIKLLLLSNIPGAKIFWENYIIFVNFKRKFL